MPVNRLPVRIRSRQLIAQHHHAIPEVACEGHFKYEETNRFNAAARMGFRTSAGRHY
jgi:hypothetical protein